MSQPSDRTVVGVIDGPAPASAVGDDDALVARLHGGDEAAFRQIVDEWSPVMLRVARGYVSCRQSAEDVVQDTWLGVINGLKGFEGRSSLRSWTFSILINRAKTRGAREYRTVASAALTRQEADTPAVDPPDSKARTAPIPGTGRRRGAPAVGRTGAARTRPRGRRDGRPRARPTARTATTRCHDARRPRHERRRGLRRTVAFAAEPTGSAASRARSPTHRPGKALPCLSNATVLPGGEEWLPICPDTSRSSPVRHQASAGPAQWRSPSPARRSR